ncbi:serine protease [Lysobacter sp. CFH 32150]|uniref:S1 family peptidase n=1 Tax=Lysobacter sp. CFH 32150 TaxID=2927128 RepID=UPI001FA7EC95|nr:serine protease [Lysobacter sp. CFH 32150]MCI4569495.1 serine protease [Lysobacter sp. CFH 32150]
MVPSNILYRTFFIKAEEYGTAFTVDVEGQEYLVTARHLLDQTKNQLSIQLFQNERWRTVSALVVGHARGEVDISVLQLQERLTHPEFLVNPTIAGIVLGQDVHFVGFPYKMWSNVGALMGGLPCAYVKKGTVSAFQNSDPQILHIDAINNEGFSGGPLFFYPPGQPREIRIAGVVSKFKVEYEDVLDAKWEANGMKVPYNTGFLVAYGSKYILSLIAAHRGG